MKFRIEKDTLGYVKVPFNKLWGAQTQRSIKYFNVSNEKFPFSFISIFLIIKKICVKVNYKLNLINKKKSLSIIKSIEEINFIKDKKNFPILIWQTGSGTQSNMNINEVIANKASELLGKNKFIHPNDDVNKGQSSNDIFPTIMNISISLKIYNNLLPNLNKLILTFKKKVLKFNNIIKIGRTHLQDAIPLTLGQEFSGYVDQLEKSKSFINYSLNYISELAIGGTAVGTGFNTHVDFSINVIKKINKFYNFPFKKANNLFSALSSHDNLLFTHGILKTLAASLIKISNDIRWMSSGPRSGLGEISIPQNEPGSSIMPGKINPTQCESIIMICIQVLGNDVTLNIAGSSGNFELNVCKPLIVHTFLQSIRLLSDGIKNFEKFCIKGIKANIKNINCLLKKSLMLVTSLTPYIGYDKSAEIAKLAYKKNITLKKAALILNYVNEKNFLLWTNPKNMININKKL